jgi:hypothetical protein
MDVAELNRLDRAVAQLAIADRDDDHAGTRAAIVNIAAAWVH